MAKSTTIYVIMIGDGGDYEFIDRAYTSRAAAKRFVANWTPRPQDCEDKIRVVKTRLIEDDQDG